MTNIVTLLHDVVVRDPGRTALVAADGEEIRFGALWDRVCRISSGLRAAGLAPGDRIVVMIPMSISLYSVLLAVIKCGGVAVFVDPWMPMARIARFAAFAQPSGFAGVGRSHLLRLLQRDLRRLPISVTTGSRAGRFPAAFSVGSWLANGDPDPFIWQPATPDDPALITFTSGSSGVPKGANRTHGFLAAQYAALCREYVYLPDDVDMTMFPVFALRNLASGIPSVIPDMDFRRVADVEPRRILRQIRRHGVTTCTASPPFIDRVVGAQEAALPLRRILTGGAPVSDAMLRRWREQLPQTAVTIVYGSTEAEPVASLSLEARLALQGKGCCVGKPIDEIQARLIRITRDPITFSRWEDLAPGPDAIGELVVSGAHVCKDYFRNPEAVAENKIVDHAGRCWHRMGDTGRVDEEGRFWLAGRVHSTILCKGAPLHPQLIEAAVAAVAPHAVRVAALEHAQALWIVIEGEPVPDLRARLPDIPIDHIVFTSRRLPLDPRHQTKIDYTELRRLLARDGPPKHKGKA